MLTVDSPGLQRRVVAITIEAGINVRRNVSLLGATISGEVTFAGGPLAGAMVKLDNGQTTTTDRAGLYSFDSLESGLYRVTVTDEGLLETAQFTLVAGGKIKKNFTLGSEISGTVLIDGLAAGGVTITLTNDTDTATATATTDAAEENLGRYTFGDLRPDPSTFYTLTFKRLGLTDKVVAVSLAVGSDVTRNVNMLAEIVGRVTTSSGAPAAGVAVKVNGVAVKVNGVDVLKTDANGNYRIPNLPSGPHVLQFVRDNLTTQTITTKIVAGSGGPTENIVMAGPAAGQRNTGAGTERNG